MEEEKTSSGLPKGKLGTLVSFYRTIKGLRQEKWGSITGYFFILPLVAMWLVFGAYPYLRGIMIPFQDYNAIKPGSWSPLKTFNGIANFIEMFKDAKVYRGMKNAVFYYLSWFPVTFVLAMFTAVILSKIRAKKLSSFFRVAITLPWVIPTAAAYPMWTQIFDPSFGYLNHFLTNVIKITQNPPIWGSENPLWYFSAIGLATTWKAFGYYMLLFLLGFYNIPEELYEAARLDGANAWQEFRHISLPGIRNIMFLFLITNVGFIGGPLEQLLLFNITSGPQMVGGPGGMYQSLSYYGYAQAFQMWRLGYGSAMWFFAGVVSLIVVSFIFKFFKVEKA